jgi:hypothetical protein
MYYYFIVRPCGELPLNDTTMVALRRTSFAQRKKEGVLPAI